MSINVVLAFTITLMCVSELFLTVGRFIAEEHLPLRSNESSNSAL